MRCLTNLCLCSVYAAMCNDVQCARYHFHSCSICPSSITRHSQESDKRQVRHVQGHRRESRSFMETMTPGLWWNGRNHVFEDVIRCERVWWGESVGMRGMRCRRVVMVVVFGGCRLVVAVFIVIIVGGGGCTRFYVYCCCFYRCFTTRSFSTHVISHQIWTCKEMSRKVSPLSARPAKVVLLVQGAAD